MSENFGDASGVVREEAGLPSTTMEERLAAMYSSQNYKLIGGGSPERHGMAGVLATNESFNRDKLKVEPLPNGYIIGTGNGAIWSMLELFEGGSPPRGIVSVDQDPAVILSGMALVELAKRDLSKKEAVAYFYGSEFYSGGPIIAHSLEEMVGIAQEVADQVDNPEFKQVLREAIGEGGERDSFRGDMAFCRTRHQYDYKRDLFEAGIGTLQIKNRINTAAMIYKHWEIVMNKF